MQQTDAERHQAESMSRRLVELRDFCLKVGVKIGLSWDDASDVYGDVCIYMLERGIKLIDLTSNYDGAIVNTMKRRALNFKRDHRRIDYDYVTVMQTREHLAAPDESDRLDFLLDRDQITARLLASCTSETQREVAKVYLYDAEFSATAYAHQLGINKHTMHGAVRHIKAKLRRICES